MVKRNLLEQALDATAQKLDGVNTNPKNKNDKNEDSVPYPYPYNPQKCKCPIGYHDLFIECRGY